MIGQDHGRLKWEDKGEVFDVYEFSDFLNVCEALGYGILGTKDGKGYGNGALFARPSDLVWEFQA